MSVYFVKEKGWRYDFTRKGQVHGPVVPNKKGGQTSRSRKEKGDKEPNTGARDPNRYGLLNIG